LTDRRLEGGCLCGAIRYEIDGPPVMATICHCSLCRRAAAAASMAWAMFKKSQVRFHGAQPSVYASSAAARRGFCPGCGTPISFTAGYLPGLIEITIGSLDRPEAITPTLHYWGTRRLPWVRYAYSAPRAPQPATVDEVEAPRSRRPRKTAARQPAALEEVDG
jgi:hypothetical protein